METKNEYKKKVEIGQDIFDLCIQEYGGLNALFLLLADNPQLDLVRKLIPGEEVKLRVEVPQDIPLNKNQMDYFREKDIKVNMQEKELLLDDVNITTAIGDTIITTPTGLTLSGSNTSSNTTSSTTLSSFLTNKGDAIVSSDGSILRPITIPTIGTSNGFALLTASGNPIRINTAILTYLTTASGDNIQTAQGDLLTL